MTTKPSHNQSAASRANQTHPHQVFHSLISLARQAKSSRGYYQAALAAIAGQFPSPYAMLYIQRATDVLEEYWHSGPSSPEFWKKPVREFLNETLARGLAGLKMYADRQSEQNAIAFISCPVCDSRGQNIGAAVLVVNCKDRPQAVQQAVRLESYILFMSYSAALTEQVRDTAAGTDQAIQTLARAAHYSSSRELAFAITNNLRNRIGCDQVSLGIARRRRVNILSISGHDSVQKGSKEVDRINEAMMECLDAGTSCQYHSAGAKETALPADFRLHRQWHNAAGNAAVASIPLKNSQGRIQAILSLRRRADKPFDPDELEKVRQTAEPLIDAFELVDHAHRSLARHARESLVQQVAQLRQFRGVLKAMALAALTALACWFCFATIPYRITVPAYTVPTHLRQVAAPAEARLEEVLAKEGDWVKQGQVLCRFNDDTLRLQRSELQAEYNIAQLELTRALADGSTTDIELARANSRFLQARLDLLDQRMARLTVTAPWDGQIVKGDPTAQVGQILPLGTPLLELTPADQWQIELKVPEQAIDDIALAMTGSFWVHAQPETAYPFTICRLSPAAQLDNKQNIFRVRADSNMRAPWLKSGMEGVARIEAGRRPVWWVALHKVIEFIQLHLWY